VAESGCWALRARSRLDEEKWDLWAPTFENDKSRKRLGSEKKEKWAEQYNNELIFWTMDG
jgi:hypothetical protein